MTQRTASRVPHRVWLVLSLCIAVVLLQAPLFAQVANGSLSGTVVDTSGAVIPKADILLVNNANQVSRHTVSNETGTFNIVAIPPGTYTVKITAQGFAPWTATGVVFNQGENRSLPNIALKVGAQSQEVTVEANTDSVPLNTGETRQTLNNNMVSQIAITGRDAAELLRLMPGMGMNGGLDQRQWNSETTKTGEGPIGKFSANGSAPNGGMTMTTDGASIVDIGNQGTQVANINQDQTAEVTYLNSAYGAEFAKGPVVFQAISKSGGNVFHGSGYLYARNGVFNATDAFLKANKVKKPDESYYYPGFTLGGPVLIPGTGFNKNRDKLFFFTGFEYMVQRPSGTLHRSVVPTDAMRNGNFTGVTGLNGDSGVIPCLGNSWPTNGGWCTGTPEGVATHTSGGIIPQSAWDPNGVAMMALLPKPNQDVVDGYNYHYLDNAPFDRWEYRIKVDYVINQKHRFSAGFTRQNETDTNNFGVWWWPSGTVPYPTSLPAATRSNVWTANLTSTFTPTLTNELTMTYAGYVNPVRPGNPAAMDPSKVGFTAKLPFSPKITSQIPNIVNWSCGNAGGTSGCFPNIYGPSFASGFENGAFGAAKYVPAISDNLSKTIGTHTMKFGFYWDQNTNQQATGYGSWAQGMYDFDYWHGNSTYNPLADMLIGHAAGFQQVSAVPTYNARYHQISLFGQDMWRATRRLTLTFGLRADHEGQWYVTDHPGIAVWDPSLYNPNATTALSGMIWNSTNKNVPISGFSSPAFYYNPRVGAAFDVFGNGKTVVRGGFGIYRWQLAYNDVAPGASQALGIQNVSTGELSSLAAAGTYTPSISAFNGAQNAMMKGDDRSPYTQSWNVTLSQAVPWNSILEASYVGSRSRDMLWAGNGSNRNFIANINKVPIGAFFKPDPRTGQTYTSTTDCAPYCGVATGNVPDGDPGSAAFAVGDYRPYLLYGDALNVISHGSFSNYHSLQMQWRKQTGRFTFLANYTFSKVLGIRDGQTNNGNGAGATINPFDMRSNYGPLAYDHTHIFNIAYVVHLPRIETTNRVVENVFNGWEISGVSQAQSGAPLQPNTAGTMNVQMSGNMISAKTIYGTNAFPAVLPVLTCDPRSGLSSGQYFNPSCFTGPQQGQVGQIVWPYIRGPKFLNNDLSFYKNFKVTERQSLQFRLNMFNFLNHALPQFGLGNDAQLWLNGTRDATNFFGPITWKQTNSSGTVNPDFTGRPKYEVGRRMLELAIKYEF